MILQAHGECSDGKVNAEQRDRESGPKSCSEIFCELDTGGRDGFALAVFARIAARETSPLIVPLRG